MFRPSLQSRLQDSHQDNGAVHARQRDSRSARGQSGGTLLHRREIGNVGIHVCGNERQRCCYFTDGVKQDNNSVKSPQKPNITEIWPNYGPLVGGTLITVTGLHLDAGRTRKVTLNDVPCPIQRCGTSPSSWSHMRWDRMLSNVPLLCGVIKGFDFR